MIEEIGMTALTNASGWVALFAYVMYDKKVSSREIVFAIQELKITIQEAMRK